MKSIRGESELKLTVVSAIHPCQYYQATFPSHDGEIFNAESNGLFCRQVKTNNIDNVFYGGQQIIFQNRWILLE